HENSGLTLKIPFDGQGAVHPGVFVKAGPGELQIRSAEWCMLRTHQGVRLHEEAGPGGPGRMTRPGFEEQRDIKQPAHRRRRNLMGKVDKIADESPRSR